MEQLPLVGGTAIGLVIALVALAKFLLGDKAAMRALETEITGLRSELASEREHRRAELDSEREQRRRDHDTMLAKVTAVEVLYDEQRREKHRLGNELTKAQLLLGVIVDLAEKCTCGALDLVDDLMKRAGAVANPLDVQEET